MDKTDKLLKVMTPRVEVRTPIATDMFIPNHSGDHSAGTVRDTPTNDLDIVNKKYVDDKIQNIKVSVTSAQILDLLANPVELIPAPGVGKVIEVLGCVANLKYETVIYVPADAGVLVRIMFLSGTTEFTSLDALLQLDGGGIFTRQIKDNVDLIPNAGVYLNSIIENYVVGDSPLDIYLTYRIITL